MFAQFLVDFSQQKVRFAQVLAFSKVAKTEGEVLVALWASQGDLEPSRATISPQSPCSLIPEKQSKENEKSNDSPETVEILTTAPFPHLLKVQQVLTTIVRDFFHTLSCWKIIRPFKIEYSSYQKSFYPYHSLGYFNRH